MYFAYVRKNGIVILLRGVMMENKEQGRYTDKSKEYSIKYAKEKLKRVPLDLPLEKYSELKAAAEWNGESINGMIKRLINAEIDRIKVESGGNT